MSQILDLSNRYYQFFGAVDTESHEEALILFAKCEEMKEKAEANPLTGINPEMSRRIILEAFALKAYLQAMSFPNGHPEQLENLKLRDALMIYCECELN